MDAGTPQALLDAVKEWRRLSGEAVTATHKKEQATGAGFDAETALRREVEFFRGKARLAIAKHPEWKDGDIAAFKTRYHEGYRYFCGWCWREHYPGEASYITPRPPQEGESLRSYLIYPESTVSPNAPPSAFS